MIFVSCQALYGNTLILEAVSNIKFKSSYTCTFWLRLSILKDYFSPERFVGFKGILNDF